MAVKIQVDVCWVVTLCSAGVRYNIIVHAHSYFMLWYILLTLKKWQSGLDTDFEVSLAYSLHAYGFNNIVIQHNNH